MSQVTAGLQEDKNAHQGVGWFASKLLTKEVHHKLKGHISLKSELSCLQREELFSFKVWGWVVKREGQRGTFRAGAAPTALNKITTVGGQKRRHEKRASLWEEAVMIATFSIFSFC